MKRPVFALVGAAAFLVPSLTHAQDQQRPTYLPPNGFVPDSITAVRIAVAVWTPIYGANQIEGERPFVAQLRGNVWRVRGSLPHNGRHMVGGVAEAEIAKTDGRILRVIHGK